MNWFTESFSHYSTLAQIQSKWNGPTSNNVSVGSAYAIGAAPQGMYTASGTAWRNLGANLATGAAGARFELVSTSNGLFKNFFGLADFGTPQISVTYSTSGVLTVTKGYYGGTVLGTVSITLTLGTIHTIELVPVIGTGTSGSFELYVDNVLLLNISGINTAPSGNNWFNQIYIGDSTQFVDIYWGDIYVNDFTGSVMNARLGNWSISAYTVQGAGNYAQFNRGGTNTGSNYGQLAKALASATSFNYDSTVNTRDNFQMAPVAGGTLLGARAWLYAQIDSSYSREAAITIESGSTDFIGTSQPISTPYGFYTQDASEDPATSALWASLAALNAAFFGYKITV